MSQKVIEKLEAIFVIADNDEPDDGFGSFPRIKKLAQEAIALLEQPEPIVNTKHYRELHKNVVNSCWANGGMIQELANSVPKLCNIVDRQTAELNRLIAENDRGLLANSDLANKAAELQAELEATKEQEERK